MESGLKLAIWKTGHQIADTVAQSLAEGLNAETYNTSDIPRSNRQSYDADISYGILRGCEQVFRNAGLHKRGWFNCDRGYFSPGHFDGYYRISYKGTQALYDENAPHRPSGQIFEDWKSPDKGYVLICPPTDAVCDFFGISYISWLQEASRMCEGYGTSIRRKDDPKPIEWHRLAGVITFNSSVGWEALRRGIPCKSDTKHSTVGSYYAKKLVDYSFSQVKTVEREPLFDLMRAHQFTLEEIRKGNSCSLMNHYLKR